ncbi:TPA: hypothetical protein ACGIKW_001735 [Acinetobacter baumannii]|uniref:hypothetical protein n=1 Tax=Acinetobacter baumannii TaxID=470 RepID=UPI00338D90F2
MKKIVIVCGKAGYTYILAGVQTGEFPLKDVIINYLDNKYGYFHFRDSISQEDESKVLEILNGVENLVHDGIKPQLNKVNY